MAIDVKKVQLEARRVTKLSIAYVKNHPIIPATIALLFSLYIFLPTLFIFFVFVVPIFIFIVVSFRLIFKIHQQNLINAKGTHEAPARKLTTSKSDRHLDRSGYSYGGAQSVRRRNSKKHVHFEDNKGGKDILFPSLVDKATLVEETMKEIREVEPKTDNLRTELGDGSGLRANKFCDEKLVDGGNSEDEEEAPERNKAVEWTEDDQKNLMDLGFSEMERNKRLESLIAKRKARKLLSMQVRRTLMNIGKSEPSNEIASILIPKASNFSRTKSGESIFSPTPGSAPSVLLPVHNPFDLPYDPQEEKPNLLGGFQEELFDNHRSDLVFRRHETFNLGAFSPRPWELDPSSSGSSQAPDFEIMPKIRESPQSSRFKNQSGKEDFDEMRQIEASQENKNMTSTSSSRDPSHQSEAPEKALDLNTSKVEDCRKDGINLKDVHNKVEGDSKIGADDIQESISSSSSEINAPFSNSNRDEVLRSLSFSVRKNISNPELDTNIRRDAFSYSENPSPCEKKVGNDPFFESMHSRSQSIASDLQVEVSEVGSQITNLSSDGGSPRYDVYMEKEGNLGNEETWAAASQLKRVEENEAKSGRIPEVSEQDIIEFGFKKTNQDIGEPISLESSQSRSSGEISKVHAEIKLPNPEASSSSVEKFLADKRIVYDKLASHQNSVENVEDSSNPIEKFLLDKQIVYGLNDRLGLVSDDQGIIDFIQDTYGQDVETVNQGTLQDFSASTSKNQAKSLNIIDGNSNKLENEKSDSVKLAKGSELAGEKNKAEKIVAEKSHGEASSSTSTRSMTKDKGPYIPLEQNKQGNELINSVRVPEIKNSSIESQSSVSNNQVGTFEIPTPIAVIPEVPVEQVAAPLSTSSSPNSVLQHKFSVDLATTMSFDEIHLASLISNAVMEQNGTSQDNSAADVTRASDSVGLQESSIPLSHSTEVNMNLNVNDRATNKGTEDKLVHTSTDIGSITPMKENEKIDGVKGVDTIKESQIPKDLEGPSLFVNTVDNMPKDSIADKAHGRNSEQKASQPLGSSMEETVNKGINVGATNKCELVQKTADLSSLTPMKEKEKVKEIEESQKPKEFGGHCKLHKKVDGSKSVVVIESSSEKLAEVNKDPKSRVASSHSTEENTNSSVNDKANKKGADIGSLTPTKENEKLETKKGGESITDIGSLTPTKENGKVGVKGVGAIKELQKSKELECPSKVNTIDNSPKDSTDDKAHAGNSVGLQKTSHLLSLSMEEKTNNAINDGSTNKCDLVQKSADVSSSTPMGENKKIETIKGVRANEESQRSKDVKVLSKIDKTIDNTIREVVRGLLVKTSDNQGDIGLLTLAKEKEKVEVIDKPQNAQEFEDPSKIQNKVDDSKSAGVIESSSGKLAVSEINNDTKSMLAPSHSTEVNRNSSVNAKATNRGAYIGPPTPKKEMEKLEAKKGEKSIEESQRPKEIGGHSKPVNTNSNVNDRASNKGTEDKLVHMSADIGSISPTKENEKINGVKGVDTIMELQMPKELQGPSKLVNIIDNLSKDSATDKAHTGNSVCLQKTSNPPSPMEEETNKCEFVQKSADVSSLTPMGENKKIETVKGAGVNEESQRSKEVQVHYIDKTIREVVSGFLVKTSDNQGDIGLLTPIKEKEKVEVVKGVNAIDESQKPKEFQGHSKPNDSKSVGVIESSSEKLAVSEVYNEPKNRVASSHSTEENRHSSVKEKATDKCTDTSSLTSMKENEQLETKKGGEAIEESQRPIEIEGHSKLDNAIGNSESVGVTKNDSETRVAPKENEEKIA